MHIGMYNCQSEKTEKVENLNSIVDAVTTSENQSINAWISFMKAVRLDTLMKRMHEIDYRKSNAISELNDLTESVAKLISSNRGGDKGIHGFIGERAQVYITNSRAILDGGVPICELIDDNGMTDYLQNGINVQQKACQGYLGLDHILKHKEMYPEFNGVYQIPKDFCETYKRLEALSPLEAGKLRKAERTLWLKIQEAKQNGITIESMVVTYDEIQKDSIYNTIETEKNGIQQISEKQKENAIASSKPTFKAGMKVIATSAAVEGVLSGASEVLQKRVAGTKIKDYSADDFKDVGKATAVGVGKGAVRGTVVYLAENFTRIPGEVAGGAVTVAFESADATIRYSKGEISGAECVEKIGKSVFVASVGTLGAKIGGKIIKIPVVGEAVGGFVFSFVADKGYGLISKYIKNKTKNTKATEAA